MKLIMILLMSTSIIAQNKVWTNNDLGKPIIRPAAKPDLTGLIHHQYKEVPEIKPGPGYYVIPYYGVRCFDGYCYRRINYGEIFLFNQKAVRPVFSGNRSGRNIHFSQRYYR